MAVHIPGGLNIVADAISRDNLFQGPRCLSPPGAPATFSGGIAGHGAARLDVAQLGALVSRAVCSWSSPLDTEGV